MGRVFLVEPPRANMDISKAEAFGELVYLFGPGVRRCSIFDVEEFTSDVAQRLKELDFDYTEDRFCVIGSLISVSITLSILGRRSWVRVLLYNAASNEYCERLLDDPKTSSSAP